MDNEFLIMRRNVRNALNIYQEVIKDAGITEKGFSVSVNRKTTPFLLGHFTLAIVGEMSAGKSSFINAFLGKKDLLPTGHFQTTCTLTEIEYSEEESLKVVFGDGHVEEFNEKLEHRLAGIVAISPKYETLPVNHINQMILKDVSVDEICSVSFIISFEKLSGKTVDVDLLRDYVNNHKKKDIPKAVYVKCKLPKGCQGWRIIDTPGVDAVGGLDAATMDFLAAKNDDDSNNVDAIMFLHKGTSNIQGASFNSFVNETFKTLSDDAKKRIFFIITHGSKQEFLNHKEEYLQKAANLYIDQYKIPKERLVVVDSLCESLVQYICNNQLDAVQLKDQFDCPDNTWNQLSWDDCNALLTDIDRSLRKAQKNVNNATMIQMLDMLSYFTPLRKMINEFVASEKTKAYNEAINTMIEDLQQHLKQRKNDLTLADEGLDAIKVQIATLENEQLQAQIYLNEIFRNYGKEALINRFNFIEYAVENHIDTDTATIQNIQRECINLKDKAILEQKLIMMEMKSDFQEFVNVTIEKNKVFFMMPDFESIEKKAQENATTYKAVYKKVTVPGICCDSKKSVLDHYDSNVDNSIKTKNFRKSAVSHIRQQVACFKKDLEKEVQKYINEVDIQLKINIQHQIEHLDELLKTYGVSNPDEMTDIIEKLQKEIAIIETGISNLEKAK